MSVSLHLARIFHHQRYDHIEKVYVLTGSDSIKANRKADLEGEKIDTTKAILFAFPSQKPSDFKAYSFRRTTFDVDALTVLFKYRPSAKGFPPQFNATFNDQSKLEHGFYE